MSSTKLLRLTPEQTARLSEIRDEWIAIGLSTEPTDREASQAAISACYAQAARWNAEGGGQFVVAPTILSLCSGIAGLDLGVHRALGGTTRTVCYVERELAAVRVLEARIATERLDDAPIWSDVGTFDGATWRGLVDGIVAGIPCQPYSVAGKGLGADDPRDLWPVTAGIIRAVEPDWFFLENVPGILRYYFDRIRPELHAMGYRTAAGLFTAVEVGAPHRRERLFVLAYSLRQGSGGLPPYITADDQWSRSARYRRNAVDRAVLLFPPGRDDYAAWAAILRDWPDLAPAVESTVRDVADGFPAGLAGLSRADQLRMLGNAVVSAQAEYAFRTLAARGTEGE